MTQSYTLWADGSTGGKRSRRHKGGKRSRRHKGGKRSRRHKGGKRSRRHKGGKRSRLTKGGKRSRRKHRGGGLGTSLLPFGLWGLQKLFQKRVPVRKLNIYLSLFVEKLKELPVNYK